MKKVLVYGMTSNPGGIESYLMNFVGYTADENLQLDFVTDFPYIAYEHDIRSFGSEIYYISRKGGNLFKHWKDFYRILVLHPEYECVYFNALDAGVALTAVIPWILRRKIVVHSHNSQTEKDMLHKICRPFLKLFSDERIACSEVAAKFMFGNLNSKKSNILIVPNAIDVEKYKFCASVREKVRKSMGMYDKLVICHVGRLSEQKNPLRVLEIFRAVLKLEQEAILLSVGTGEMEEQVRNYAQMLGIADQVMFLGARNDVDKLLQAADVFLLPSKYEGLPIVALEAQVSGLPCILSDSISSEVNISNEVFFVSLNETDEKWAQTIVSYVGKKRFDSTKEFKDTGYDKRYISSQTKELIAILENR